MKTTTGSKAGRGTVHSPPKQQHVSNGHASKNSVNKKPVSNKSPNHQSPRQTGQPAGTKFGPKGRKTAIPRGPDARLQGADQERQQEYQQKQEKRSSHENGIATWLKAPADSTFETYISNLAPSGRSAIQSLLNRCASILDAKRTAKTYPWHQLTYAKVARLRSELIRHGYAVASVNMALAALRSLANTAFNMDLLDAAELTRIRAVKRVRGESRRKGRSLDKDEIRAMLSAIASYEHKGRRARDKAILMVACGAGLRAAELVALDIDDYVVEDGELLVRLGKGRKFRSVHVAKRVCTALNGWIKLRGQDPGPLFCKISRAGTLAYTALSKEGLSSILDEMRRYAEVAKFTPHDLRRTFITQLLDSGVDINVVRQLAGHSEISTTARYDCRGEGTKISASRGFCCW